MRSCVLLLLLTASVAAFAQFPDYRVHALDLNTEPAVGQDDVPHFYPADGDRFFFGFDFLEPNPELFFTGERIDTVLRDGSINGRVYGEYAGGYLFYYNDGEFQESTIHIDPVTYDTTTLAPHRLTVRHVFPDGRRLLSGNGRLFVIDDTPESLDSIGEFFSDFSVADASFADRYIYRRGNATWVSDGTAAGTLPLGDFSAGDSGKYVAIGERLYINDRRGGLYVSDGTAAGTAAVDLGPLAVDGRVPSVSNPRRLNGRLVFTANGRFYAVAGADDELTDLAPFQNNFYVAQSDSLLVFRGGPDADDLWVTDGTTDGTRELFDFSARNVEREDWAVLPIAALADGTLYFETFEAFVNALWVLTPAGELTEIQIEGQVFGAENFYYSSDNELFIFLRGDTKGLYKHVAGEDGLTRLANFFNRGNNVPHVILDDGLLIQGGPEDEFGQTYTILHYAGTTTRYSFPIGMNNSSRGEPAAFQTGDRLVGLTVDRSVGEAVFELDLPTGEYEVIKDLFPNTFGSDAANLMAGSSAAFFTGNGNNHYGTHRLNRFDRLFNLNDRVEVVGLPGTEFNILYVPASERPMWLTNARAEGTEIVTPQGVELLSNIVALNERFYYLAGTEDGERYRYRLMRFNPFTRAHTVVNETILPGSPSAQRPTLASSGDHLYFPMISALTGISVWRSTGYADGTEFFGLASNEDQGIYPYAFTSGDGFVVYRAGPSPQEIQYGVIIREAVGDQLAVAGLSDTRGGDVARVGDRLVLTAGGTLLVVPDAETAATRLVNTPDGPGELSAVDDERLVYTTGNSSNNGQLWRYDFAAGEATLLLDALKSNRRRDGIAVLDTLVLIARQWQGESGGFDELRLLNVNNGASLLVPDSNLHNIRTVVTDGERFLYHDTEDFTYGNEIFAVDFSGDFPVSVPDTEERLLEVTVFPNPAGEWVRLKLPEGERYAVAVFDLTGRRVRTGAPDGTVISLNGLRNGTYVMVVRGKTSGKTASRKIVVQR